MLMRLSFVFLLMAAMIACSVDEPTAVVAKFQTEGSGCKAPCVISFTDASENKGVYKWQYRWTVDNGPAFSTEKNASYSFVAPGTYRVTLTVHNDKYGSSSFEDTVLVAESPRTKASFEIEAGECQAPCIVTFNNRSQNATAFLWDFGDGQTSKENSPKHQYLKPGAFPVKLVASLGATKDSISQLVTILMPANTPLADFSFAFKDAARKDSVAVVFTNKSQFATKYVWNFGDGSPLDSLRSSPEHTYARKDTDVIYKVKLLAKTPNSSSEKTLEVPITKKQ